MNTFDLARLACAGVFVLSCRAPDSVVEHVKRTALHERLILRVINSVRVWRVARGPMNLKGARIEGERVHKYTAACDALDMAFAALEKYEREHT